MRPWRQSLQRLSAGSALPCLRVRRARRLQRSFPATTILPTLILPGAIEIAAGVDTCGHMTITGTEEETYA